jgi:hypothetical protein
MTITATYDTLVQQYKVIYQTNSDVISADPAEAIVYYGDKLTAPTVLGIPEGVTFIGWYTPEGRIWDFEQDELLDHLVLTARWEDANKPYVILKRETFNTFSYEATDNLGISGYALVQNSEAVPDTWTPIKPVANFIGVQSIEAAGEYWFWVTDHAGNIASAKIIAYPITYSPATGTAVLRLTENGATLTDFGLDGTTITVFAELDPHYENLHVEINGDGVENNSEHLLIDALEVRTACTPKNYTVTFVTGKESENVRVDSQTITYLHRPVQPLALYNAGYIIGNWYRDPELQSRWNFETDVVEGDTNLYAEWQEYRTPTKITIQIPAEANFTEWEDAPREPIRTAYTTQEEYEAALAKYNEAKANFEENRFTVSVNYTQNRPNDVKIYFGDDSGEFSSEATIYATSVSHTYAQPGEYVIEIYGTPHGYALGGSYSSQAVDPAYYVTDIEFAWDITTTRDYAFKGAQITELRFTPYMTTIATAAFAACKKLEEVKLPPSIYRIGTQAFEGCINLIGDKEINAFIIPKTISEVGNNVFANCSSLKQIIFEENGNLREISSQFANNSGITELIIPHHIQSIKSEAFGNCGKLEKVVLLNPDLVVGERVFNSTVKLNSAGPISYGFEPGQNPNFDIEYAWTTKIPNHAFSAGVNFRQSYLYEVTLPDTLTDIGYAAFKGAAIKQINLPANLQTIGEEAFYFTALLSLEVPSLVTTVGARAFGLNGSLNSALLRFGGSTITVQAPKDGWFFGCNADLVPKIPAALFQDSMYLAEQYGPCWNVYDYNQNTFESFTLGYAAI